MLRATSFAQLRKVNALPVCAALVVAGAVTTLARCIGRTGAAGAIGARRDTSRGALNLHTNQRPIATPKIRLAALIHGEGATRACPFVEAAMKARTAVREGGAGLTRLCAGRFMAACLLRHAHNIATDFREAPFVHGAREIDTWRAHQEGNAGLALRCIKRGWVTEPGEKGCGGGRLGLAVLRHRAKAQRRESRPAACVHIATCSCKIRDERNEGSLIEHRRRNGHGMALRRG